MTDSLGILTRTSGKCVCGVKGGGGGEEGQGRQ